MTDIASWGSLAIEVGLVTTFIFGTPRAIIAWRGVVAGRLRPVAGTVEKIDVIPAGTFGDLSRYYAVQGLYRYSVDGRVFTGDRIALEFKVYPGEAAAREAIGGAVAGGPVTVWYDAANPKRAVLDKARPVARWPYTWGTVAGLAVTVAGAVARSGIA